MILRNALVKARSVMPSERLPLSLRALLIVLGFLLFAPGLAIAEAGAELAHASRVAVQGETLKRGEYRLSVEYVAAGPIDHRALFVRAEPSGTLVLGHWDEAPPLSMGEKALMVTSGPLGNSHPRATFLWTPEETDDAIVVSLLTAAGEETVVAAYRFDEPLTQFRLETHFDEQSVSVTGVR